MPNNSKKKKPVPMPTHKSGKKTVPMPDHKSGEKAVPMPNYSVNENLITQEENDYAHDLLEIMLMMEGYDTEQIDEFLEHADEHDLNEQIERIISTDYSEIIISEGIIDLLEEEGYITEGKGDFIKGLWQGGKNWFKNLFGKGKKAMPKPPKLTPEKVAPKTQAPKILGPDGKPVVKTPPIKTTKTPTKTPTKTTKTPTKTTTKGNALKTGAKLAAVLGGAAGLYALDQMRQGSGQDSNSSNSGSNTNSSSSDNSGSGSNSGSNTGNQNGSGKSTMPSYLSAVNRGDSAEMERLAKGGRSYDIRDRPTDARGAFDPTKEKTRWKYGQVYAVREDYYDIVANYLLEMGHADTLDEVNYIMLEMDGQTIVSIAEQMPDPIDPVKHNAAKRNQKIYNKAKGGAGSEKEWLKRTGPQLPGV